jgi:vitamin B12 transporter
MKPYLVSFLFLTSLTASIHAQQALQPAAEEIVVTASAVPETVATTPASVTVITREEIEDRAARDIADVLREVPGVNVSRTGSSGRTTSLFTRGSNSTHTLVLWNGIEINNPYFSGYDWGRFSTLGVEQVEVVRGPYSALYGSDAVAGVVNILTAPKKSELRVAAESGSHGLRNGQVVASIASKATQFSASLESRTDDGWDENDDFSQKSANVFFKWTAGDHLSIGAIGRYTDYDLGVPFNLNAAGDAILPSLVRRQDGNERQIAIPVSLTFGRVTFDVSAAESRRDDHFEDPEDPFGFVDSDTESLTRRARVSMKVQTGIGTIVGGGEYERAVVDDVNTYGINLQDNRRVEKSLFLEDRFSHEVGDFSRIELSAGLRYDRYDTFGSETSPRLAGAFVFGGNKVRAAYGQSFRAPSVGELYFPFSGNVALQPEKSRSFELGYDRSLGDRGLLSLTAFTGDYEDLIVFDNATFAFSNIGAASSRGVEISAEQSVAEGLSSGFSYTFLDTEEDATGKQLLRRPRHSGSIHTSYRKGSMETNVILLHNGSREDVLPVAPFARATNKSYTTYDVNVQMHIGKLIPYVKVENLTNEKYEEVLGYSSPQRRMIFGVRYSM